MGNEYQWSALPLSYGSETRGTVYRDVASLAIELMPTTISISSENPTNGLH
jgi:hypothetical protein